jgi:hypothetical protein
MDLFLHSATNMKSIGSFLHNMMSKFDSQTSQQQIGKLTAVWNLTNSMKKNSMKSLKHGLQLLFRVYLKIMLA